MSFSQYVIQDKSQDFKLINASTFVLIDPTNRLDFEQIRSDTSFHKYNSVGNFGLSNSTYWFLIPIENNTNDPYYTFGIANATLDTVEIYHGQNEKSQIKSINYAYKIPSPLFAITSDKKVDTFYLKVRSTKPLSVPIYTSSIKNALNINNFNKNIFSAYLGIVFIMFFYNLFIFITTKDIAYRDYVIYIFFLALTQFCLQGYFQMVFNKSPSSLISNCIPISTALVGISSSVFIKNFLNLKILAKWANSALNFFIFVYIITIALTFMNYEIAAQLIIQFNTVIGIFIALYYGVKIQRNGFRAAIFFNASWSFFLLSVIVWIMKDTGILSFNAFTNNSILIGSTLSIMLLGFALADQINFYKREKEITQEAAVITSQRNEQIIREQNRTLEIRVNERTAELSTTNEDLKQTLHDLKEAEIHLVESEKMASLGQLTAGIAHEINNPINFVTSNVNPLRRDVNVLIDTVSQIEAICVEETPLAEKQKKIDDLKVEIDYEYLKEEIDFLLKGIDDGATRTAEIVKGLRIFSRLDEDDLKKADLNEGLSSTIILCNNLMENKIVVERKYSENPWIECYPGKLNQVFLNIMSNAIYAIHKRWNKEEGGKLTVETKTEGNNFIVAISDNGTGMTEETRKKIFEPFFTTKEVGEGTGLGMSIVYNTIHKHNGAIAINSEVGLGTTFEITLPVSQ